jgi:hypothetical protein
MNKTLKIIAWICLALGLLGMVVSAGALIVGRTLLANRQAAAVEQDKGLTAGNRCIAEDANKDGKPEGDCLQRQLPGQPGVGKQGFGGRQGFGGMMAGNREGFNGRHMNGRGIFALFFMALGPILAVVGAVILLVNREPKAAVVKEEKELEVKADKKKEIKK